MKIFPIISREPLSGHLIVYGRYGSWYRDQFVKYCYYLGQGEFIVGQIESLIYAGGITGALVLVIERWSGWLCPWPIAIVFAFGIRILKVYVGRLDKNVFKVGQAMSEYGIKAKTAPKSVEVLERIVNIEKKVSPETADKKYDTYFEEGK